MIPTYLSFPFEWNIFFHPLIFNLCVFLTLKWVSWKQRIVGSFFFIQSVTLCLLIGAFSPLTFKTIIDRYVFITILDIVYHLAFVFLLLFLSFYFHFFFWGLIIFFFIMLVFSSFCFLWICCIFLICGSPVLSMLTSSYTCFRQSYNLK